MVSKKEYGQMTKKASPNTKCIKNIVLAFIIGGAICTLGQFFYFYMEIYAVWKKRGQG